jgi:hypothetical protein
MLFAFSASPMKPFDLTLLSYEDWIVFVFDHPVHENSTKEAWYWQDGRDFKSSNASTSVAYLTRMCREMPILSNRFTLPQINQGVWFLFSGFPCTDAIYDRSVPLSTRIDCIKSMFIPFEKIVAGSMVEEMENCFEMWWDLLSHSLHAAVPPAEEQLCDAFLMTLTQILRLDDFRCQYYALHGLGHLQHPRCSEVIDDYVREHRSDLEPEQLEWIQKCREGTVM